MNPYYTVLEVSKITGLSEETIKTKRKRGFIRGHQVQKGKRLVWVYTNDDLDSLKSETSTQNKNGIDFEEILISWEQSLYSGWLTGKPVGQKTIEGYKYALKVFSRNLKLPLNLGNFNQENLRNALSFFKINQDLKKCNFSKRDLMYKAFLSFSKYLIEKKIKPSNFLDGVQKLKPKRVYPARKTVVYEDGLKKLIETNRNYTLSRSPFDIELTEMILKLATYAGLRKSEIIALQVKDINLERAELWVMDGKGHKNRPIGMRHDLVVACQQWLQLRSLLNPYHDTFLICASGAPITPQVIRGRIERLRKKAGIDITCHGLRRAFVTIHAHAGIPLPELQQMAGHRDLKTTQGYTLTNVERAMASLQNFGAKPVINEIKNEAEIKPITVKQDLEPFSVFLKQKKHGQEKGQARP
jgi:site-specific recombinase XerD